MTVEELDALPASEAEALLAACCGARAWVSRMVARRPFRDTRTLLRAAHDVWWTLGADDWKEAFAHHPRIGERAAAVAQEARARAWSSAEQAGMAAADEEVRGRMRALNDRYEIRFGYIYLVSAAGRSPEELLALLETRIDNDPETELRVAAAEQATITRLRLLKVLGAGDP